VRRFYYFHSLFCTKFFSSLMVPRRTRTFRRPPRKNQRGRPLDPIFTAQRFPVPNFHIPQHVANPSVSRIIRIQFPLTAIVPSLNISYGDIALQDATDYGTPFTRYATMRVSQVRAWAESPNQLPDTQAPFGLILTDIVTGFTVSDRPNTGSTLNSIGLRFPFTIRQSVENTASTVELVTAACDQLITTGIDFNVTMDFSVEFYA
jgi:hypothetical protein